MVSIELFYTIYNTIEFSKSISSAASIGFFIIFEPIHEKVCLRGLRQGKTNWSAQLQRLIILIIETRDIILSKQRITKALIRLRGCAG